MSRDNNVNDLRGKLGSIFPSELSILKVANIHNQPEKTMTTLSYEINDDEDDDLEQKTAPGAPTSSAVSTAACVDAAFGAILDDDEETDGTDVLAELGVSISVNEKAVDTSHVTVKVDVPTFKPQKDNSTLGVKEMIQEKKFVTLRTRIMVTFMLTRLDFVGLAAKDRLDSVNVEENVGGTFDFTNPLKIANERSPEGFLRASIIRVLRNVASWNSVPFMNLINADETESENERDLINQALISYDKLVFKNYRPSTPIAHIKKPTSGSSHKPSDDDDDYEIGEDDSSYDNYYVGDLLSPTAWQSRSVDDAGVNRISVNLNLAHHNLALYDTGDKFKIIARQYNSLFQAIEKYCPNKNITVSMAVVLDNSMLKLPVFRDLLDDLITDDKIKFEMYTAAQLRELAVSKAKWNKQEFGELWTETEEMLPTDIEDIAKIMPEGALLFVASVHEEKHS